MELKEAIARVSRREDLSLDEMRSAMRQMMSGEADPVQMGGLLIALAMKGESTDEITAAVEVMRELMTPVHIEAENIVDIVGTGGDGAGLFNVSTASSFVAAAAGAHVAKHGGKGVSSTSGSADLLARAGITLNLAPEEIGRCVQEVGVGFMFAPNHHTAMRHAVPVRKSLGVRTMFNILGPLTNPSGAKQQVIGVYDESLVAPFAEVLKRVGSTHALIVHAADGLDEFSIAATSRVAELKDGTITTFTLEPEDVGLPRHSLDALKVDNVDESLVMVKQALKGEGAAADMVAFNAGAAIYVSGIAGSIKEGVAMAQDAMDTGLAHEKMRELSHFTSVFEGDGDE
ncbi:MULTISPECIES: anthranilate phosphoribosyltransferase [Larsenimonas]|uniref:Anthranilate phosphoribosyltransferase n=1 Tax=Larsenimonas suaedae TaxID=1851019 RepID=A0ABU1GUE3_9GAMM|nr:anthranilate phosphoribosyltransferase [Larsenimonas suaedae]MCM2970946.1 anthranilate phosphoribosyltransferase [Larsenimonas suaedae]MCM5703052.1 anthranilate phosphoribosyltransferase [Larsenimonas salina]MDR5895655.1 anthranilate phosphoribosyltransferase [Larsenimonas suaedae]